MTTAGARVVLAVAAVLYVAILGGGMVATSRGMLPDFPGIQENIAATAMPNIVPAQPSSERHYEEVSLDFGRCAPERTRISVAFGSTTIAILGRDGAVCRLDFGGEVENPNWDGKLTQTCRVPARRGVVTFAKKDGGVDLSSIEQYCTDVP